MVVAALLFLALSVGAVQASDAALPDPTVGVTPLTVLMLLLGLVAHGCKQLIVTRKVSTTPIGIKEYVIGHMPETILAVSVAVAMYLGLPELFSLVPDFAKAVGLNDHQTPLSSFVCGFISNVFADFLGGRANAIAGTNK